MPLTAIDSLLTGQALLADQWFPDPESACLLRRDRPSSSPFRAIARSSAAVDRLTKTGGEVKSLAGVEFEAGAGLWTVARFRDAAAESAWSQRVQGAFRLLADSGFGGGRSKGWGQTQAPEFQKGAWPGLLLPKVGRAQRNGNGDAPASSFYWLLSLYSPSPADTIDWTGGDYRLVLRSGRVESSAASGALKKQARMISEGAVISASAEPVGVAVDVAPEGFAHPVYRSGLALALLFPSPRGAEKEKLVEEPVTAEETVEPVAAAEISEVPEQQEEVVGHKEPSMGDPAEQPSEPSPVEKSVTAEEAVGPVPVEAEQEEIVTHKEPSMGDPTEQSSEPAPVEESVTAEEDIEPVPAKAEHEEVVTHQEPSMGALSEPSHADEPPAPSPVEESATAEEAVESVPAEAEQEEIVTHKEPSMGGPAEPSAVEEPVEPETIEEPKEPEPPVEEPPPQQEHDHEI